VFVTNEDPYDEDPDEIIRGVAEGIIQKGGREEEDFETISERGHAIEHAISEAGPGDVVVIAGKGSETVMAVSGGKQIPWSDKEKAREVLYNISRNDEIHQPSENESQ